MMASLGVSAKLKINKSRTKSVILIKSNSIRMNLLNRITIDPQICHGKPCVRGMRWPVEVVIDMLGAGMSIEEILEDHPELEKEDIFACLQYAKLSLSGHNIKEVA
ncbi:DUF433 domain-containing protein [Catalinimonas sp. 4WD22]|uniref:DUF433 domain-containing protein n=1 Tax=Catalinimonas locisalis TaxID=3133978 RepID=UPI0031014CEB